mmetsp:Transcript_14372/g.32813  ORF Transcript_14372/g.32813 Transcript_14372/m.32813 type:complete len:204 (+) Transcript_14372:1005-1616(+)
MPSLPSLPPLPPPALASWPRPWPSRPLEASPCPPRPRPTWLAPHLPPPEVSKSPPLEARPSLPARQHSPNPLPAAPPRLPPLLPPPMPPRSPSLDTPTARHRTAAAPPGLTLRARAACARRDAAQNRSRCHACLHSTSAVWPRRRSVALQARTAQTPLQPSTLERHATRSQCRMSQRRHRVRQALSPLRRTVPPSSRACTSFP